MIFLTYVIQATEMPIEEEYGAQRGLCWKINLIWSESMKVSWSAYELLYFCLF